MEDSKPGAATATEPAATRRRQAGESKRPAARGRVKKDANGLKFEAIKILTSLPEDGKFFLIYEDDGKKETVNCWN